MLMIIKYLTEYVGGWPCSKL